MQTLSDTLSERHRAMLAEMGIRTHWLPRSKAAVAKAAAARAQPRGHSPDAAQQLGPKQAPKQVPSSAAAARRMAIAASDVSSGVSADASLGASLGDSAAAAPEYGVFPLHAGRLPGAGGADARPLRWMVIGEATDWQPARQGLPFAGPAGQLFEAMLAAIGLSLPEGMQTGVQTGVQTGAPPVSPSVQADAPAHGVCIACPAGLGACDAQRGGDFLRGQIALARPHVILVMSRLAAQALLQTGEPVGRLRGRVHACGGVPLVVTYHPSYLLRNLPDKARAWQDLCLALQAARDAAGAGV